MWKIYLIQLQFVDKTTVSISTNQATNKNFVPQNDISWYEFGIRYQKWIELSKYYFVLSLSRFSAWYICDAAFSRKKTTTTNGVFVCMATFLFMPWFLFLQNSHLRWKTKEIKNCIHVYYNLYNFRLNAP